MAEDTANQETDPCTPRTATAADGTLLTASAHGGHVLGWVPPGGPDRLWLSPWARCGPGLAVRGGVPVVFPQFSDRGPLPKHGFARDRPWSLEITDGTTVTSAGEGDSVTDHDARIVATLCDDAATRGIWPHRFTLTLTATADARRLSIELGVRNDGDEPFTFTGALHSYLAVGDPAGARITGLAGVPTEQNAHPGPTEPMIADPLPTTQARDVAARGTQGPAVLADPGCGDLTLTSTGFDSLVLWNPGHGHTLDDVPQGSETGFVCVEPAVLDAVTLPGGSAWAGVLHVLR